MIILSDTCPICESNKIEIKTFNYYLPKIGKSLIYIFKCLDCGYRTTEIIPLENKGEKIIEFKIKSEKDLKKIFLKSPFAKVIVKEIELEIIPGSESKFQIFELSNYIRELIDRLERSKVLFIEDEEKLKSLENKIRYLNDVLENKRELTIIVYDEKGYSDIYELDEKIK